jgi:hypothetical protein
MPTVSSTPDVATQACATRAWAEDRRIFLELSDGRVLGFPADRFKLLKVASMAALAELSLRLDGTALRWEKLDEDIT